MGNGLSGLIRSIEKAGEITTIEHPMVHREKLTTADYRKNWYDFMNDAADFTEDGRWRNTKGSKEREQICRKYEDKQRIKIVRAGIVVAIGDGTDILVKDQKTAVSLMREIATAFDKGDLDEQIETWMAKRDATLAKAKWMKENKKLCEGKTADEKTKLYEESTGYKEKDFTDKVSSPRRR